LERATAALSVPVLAIGGVTVERIVEVASAGAAGVAAIGVFEAGDRDSEGLRQIVSDLRTAFLSDRSG
jgi:thiamine monophosphate synthase